ncbi:MAG: UDP-N-acetylmuramoyl-L-alanyl-D-glutamate--2,6-diaminopimelate ligase [Candidatus Gracilibacteria bacterium]|nr:UDP-N-acetylmuramoyl-L-alanyl-D-glutamate--2,6-diaminopimelate ligase [Candidatus Gracilibacteria bacterium]
MHFLRSLIALDSPLRIFYHYIRGVIALRFYGNPARDMVVIGITGSKGKTTVTNLVARGLEHAGKKVFMFSTANYSINGQWSENNMKMTSPSPFVLQRLLKEAKEAGCEYAVIETSSHSIFYNRNYGIDYDVAVLTNISQDHLDLHKTMDNYAATKLRFFKNLVEYRRKPGVKKVAIVNIDSDYANMFLSETTPDVMYTYGMSTNAQIRPQNIRYLKEGTEFEIKMPSNIIALKTKLRGSFNVSNILAAASVLVSQKIDIPTIVDAIESVEVIPGRLEEIENSRGLTIFVDYAHTEDSLRNVLETIQQMEGIGRIITVFGATGDRDTIKRPKMGRVADTLSDVVILTEDDNYTENSLKIIKEVSMGIKRKEGEGFWIVPSRMDAIRTALIMAEKEDVVIIAGKGAETSQVTNAGSIAWDDRVMTRKILREIDENEIVMG